MESAKVAVVTGASSGIGWELGKQLATRGYRVGLIARREASLVELSNIIAAAGGKACVAAADVGNRPALGEALRKIEGELGPVDMLIANAGVGIPTKINPTNLSDVELTFQVNLLGVVYAFDAVLPGMVARGRGHLAAVSSLAAYVSFPGESAYCASKAAVNSYLDGLRVQLRGRGIRVTTLCPGFVRTPMTAKDPYPQPGMIDADDAARRMLNALERGYKIFNFPWLTTRMVKWLSIMPDWLMARVVPPHEDNPW